jgi:hypothetical protein
MEELRPLPTGHLAESVFLLSWPSHSSQPTRRGGTVKHRNWTHRGLNNVKDESSKSGHSNLRLLVTGYYWQSHAGCL